MIMNCVSKNEYSVSHPALFFKLQDVINELQKFLNELYKYEGTSEEAWASLDLQNSAFELDKRMRESISSMFASSKKFKSEKFKEDIDYILALFLYDHLIPTINDLKFVINERFFTIEELLRHHLGDKEDYDLLKQESIIFAICSSISFTSNNELSIDNLRLYLSMYFIMVAAMDILRDSDKDDKYEYFIDASLVNEEINRLADKMINRSQPELLIYKSKR